MASATRIQASVGDHFLLIRAAGPCTFGCCPGLKSFVQRFRKPDFSEIYGDLTEADSIDSTFAGLLLSIATRKLDPRVPDLRLLSLPPRVAAATHSMHVERFFRYCEQMPEPVNPWMDVLTSDGCHAGDANLIIEAHSALIQADDRNVVAFGRVVDGLRGEQSRRAAMDDTNAGDAPASSSESG